MSTKIIKRILPKDHRLRPGGNYKKQFITIHSTANLKSSAENERNWLDNPANKRQAAWHYCIDEKDVFQAIPDNEEAWHCGNETGNKFSLGIEICESGNRRKTLENAVSFVAVKLMELGLTTDNLRKHKDWSNKNCPRIFVDKKYIKDDMDWNWFVEEVKKAMDNNRFEKIEDIPIWAVSCIKKLIVNGAFADENKLNLSEDMVRILVIMDRMKLFKEDKND